MSEKTIKTIIQQILVKQFNVPKEKFEWNQPLEKLNEDFRILGILLDLEKLLTKRFERTIPLLEHIDIKYHTCMDLVNFVKSILDEK